mmetsp:Transcript_105638/g.204539  ORF Transcript_105638/g.204539 Transcript_105638/m.204539 type:complete len:101 (-) Transcript_105638:59-361(-)
MPYPKQRPKPKSGQNKGELQWRTRCTQRDNDTNLQGKLACKTAANSMQVAGKGLMDKQKCFVVCLCGAVLVCAVTDCAAINAGWLMACVLAREKLANPAP